MMNAHELRPIGLELTDVDLRRLGPVDRLRGLLADHGVLIVRDQHDVDDDAFVSFLREFGELMFTVGEDPLPGQPDLNVISNVGRTTPPRSVFHVDTSYVSSPPAYTALRAVRIPAAGGQTVFTNQYRAYDTLSEEVRQRLEGRRVKHEVTGVDPGAAQEHEAWHPVFREHPLIGRRSLYLSTPQRCTAIEGLDEGEARALITALYEHSTDDANCLRHTWRAGDVVVWDNACVLHKADHSGVSGDRVMHRGMVSGGTGYGLPVAS